ncbi:MAG: hypothetical protein AAF533_02860 [Acidobacteriota bacterium]
MSRNVRIGLFLLVTLGWSLAWFALRPLSNWLASVLGPVRLLFALTPALGLALMGGFLRRSLPERLTSWLGPLPKLGLLALVVPPACLVVLGVDNGMGVNAHVFGLCVGLLVVVYAFLEEVGWRGYLNEELSFGPKWLPWVVVGASWWLGSPH